MGKCCSKIKVKPALESATETDTKSTGWIRRIANTMCMGKHSVAVESCTIQEYVVKLETGDEQSTKDESNIIKETVVKSEFGIRQPAEYDACVIEEAVVNSEFGLKQPAEDDVNVIQEAVVKTEYGLEDEASVIRKAVVKSECGLNQPVEDDACVLQEAVVISESGLKQSTEYDACVIQEAVVKSECGLKQPVEDDVCVILEAVVKSECGLKQPVEDDACVILEAVVKTECGLEVEDSVIKKADVKSECGLQQPAEYDACVIHEDVFKTEFELKQHAEDDACVIKDAVVKSESEYSQESQMFGIDELPLKPIIIKRDAITSDSETSETSEDSGRVTPTRPSSSKSSRVYFADDKGFALATVHIMTEPSDEPVCIAADDNWSFTNGIEPPCKLAFSQPAAEYMAFREKVDKCRVSLENVILSGYHVQGTIKVKNICFEKRVFVRVTFDSWVTSQDVEAKYVQPYAGASVHSFDTFSFEFEIDTRSETNKKVQFAVCFETPTGQHWDNNRGANYEIIPHENADCF